MINKEYLLFIKIVLQFRTYKEAAKALGYSEKFIKEKIKIIYKKLGVKNRVQAYLKVFKQENILKSV